MLLTTASTLISASVRGDRPSAVASPQLCRRLAAILLTVALATLTPLAHGSPPDPTWIAGLYDDADHDDAILAVTGSIASLDRQPLHDPHDVDFAVAFVPVVDESQHATPSLSSNHTRAPPTS
jgi:hypothetical protein